MTIDQAIEKIQTFKLEPGEVVVFSTPTHLPQEAHARIAEVCQSLFPDNKAVVLENGMALTKVKAEEWTNV